MIIAVASDSGASGMVAEHFGRCAGFVIFQARDGLPGRGRAVVNPFCANHIPGAVPEFLISMKVDVVIAGGVGPNAVRLLEAAGIRVVFAEGKAADAARRYLDGRIGKAENVCSH